MERDKEIYERQIKIVDAQIDGLVYDLYGLTEEEIKVVKENGWGAIASRLAWMLFSFRNQVPLFFFLEVVYTHYIKNRVHICQKMHHFKGYGMRF